MWLRLYPVNRPEYEPALKPQELKPGEQVAPEEDEERIVTRADGKKLRLLETGTYVRLRAFNIKYAVELIRKNPNGPKAADGFENK
jgi:hypothetical protein